MKHTCMGTIGEVVLLGENRGLWKRRNSAGGTQMHSSGALAGGGNPHGSEMQAPYQ